MARPGGRLGTGLLAACRAVCRALRSPSLRHWTRCSGRSLLPRHGVGALVARNQQFGHAHPEIRAAALREVVPGRWNREVDVGKEMLGVLAIEVVVTDGAVVG